MKRWHQNIKNAGVKKVRKDAVKGIEILMTFSPDAKNITADQWRRKCREFLKEEFYFDANILQYDLHQDETTVHCHAIVQPITRDMRLSAKDWLGGREKLSGIQDRFHQKMKPFGLDRGVRRSSRKHIPIAEYHANLAAHIFDPAPQIPKPPLMGNREEWQKEQQAKLDQMTEAAEVAKVQAKASEKRAAADRKTAAKAKATSAKLRQELEAQKEEIAKLKRVITPEEVLAAHGYQEPTIKNSHEAEYQTEIGKISVNRQKGIWSVDWERGRGGKSVIDLEMELSGSDFRESVSRLKTWFGDENTNRTIAQIEQKKAKSIKPAPNNANLHKSKWQRDDSKWRQVWNYLKARAIPEWIIESQHKAGTLWANKFGSAVFGCFEGGNIVCAHVRGTQSEFKATYGPKKAPFVSNGRKGALTALVESPIDAMAFTAMTGERAITYGGHALNEYEHIDLIAFDADEAGQKAAKRIARERMGTRIIKPEIGKDWAEEIAQDPTRKIDINFPGQSNEYEGPSISL